MGKELYDGWEQVGNNDLRYQEDPSGGFHHVALRDADDGDTIIINEDDLPALYERLRETLKRAFPGYHTEGS